MFYEVRLSFHTFFSNHLSVPFFISWLTLLRTIHVSQSVLPAHIGIVVWKSREFYDVLIKSVVSFSKAKKLCLVH